LHSFVPPASSRHAIRLVLGFAALTYALSVVGVAPVRAHDSAGGTPDVTITIGSGLSDRAVRVSVGDIVRFVNRDGDRHRMRSRSGPEFDTGNLEPGDSYQVRLSVAGTYAYHDERNDDAAAYRGRIVVTSDGGSGGSGGSTSDATQPSGGSAGGSAGGGAASSATVTIGDDFYDPTSVRIAVGGTVAFRNTGDDEHSATSSAFDTGVLGGGASARKTFKTAGTFSFVCIFHSDMRGTIEVVAPSGGNAPPEPAAPQPTATPAPTAVPAPTGDPAPQVAAAPSAVAVDAADFAFSPATVEVAAGGRITWTNRGAAPHSVAAKDGAFDSGMLEGGATFAQSFETPGSYAYLCAFHPEMTATIRVVAPSTASAGGTTSGPAAAVGDSTTSASPSGQPALAGGTAGTGAATPPVEAPAAAITANPDPTTELSSLGGLVVAISLVSAAAALFSRAIRGTVRSPE
jgi:plastocyanin